ncbi:MAG: hypothetical protein AABY22_00665, partial [Nanoarchaeota archaeon]
MMPKLYEKNAKKRERAKELYLKNREEKILYSKEYRKKNLELIRIKKKLKYLEGREVILEKAKKYYEKNALSISEKGKEYRKTHREVILIRNRNRKSLLRTLTKNTDVTNNYVKGLIDSSIKCPLCSMDYKNKGDKHIDHILPINVGGMHRKNNI